jgi:mRNA interferase MazF
MTFDPQAGHEQAGRRPALILSPRSYNQRSGLTIACPVSTKAKGYPFETVLPAGCGVAGVVLSDHLKNLDWKARKAERAGRAPAVVLEEVRAKLAPLLGF